MKQLTALLIFIVAFTFTSQAQNGYVSAITGDTYGIELGAQANNFFVTFGYEGSQSIESFTAGVDFRISPYSLGEVNPFLSLGARGMLAEHTSVFSGTQESSKMLLGIVGRALVGVEYKGVYLSSGIAERFYVNDSRYWVPVKIGFNL